MKSLKTYILAGVLILTSFNPINAQSEFRSLKQPDGTTFQAIERGDEWLRFFETPEGHIVRRGNDGYFHFYDINNQGEFVSTNLRAGIDLSRNAPVRPYQRPAVERALIRKIKAYNEAAEANRKRYLQRQRRFVGSSGSLGKASSPGAVTMQSALEVTVGVLLVEFDGRPHYEPEYEVSDFETMLFSDDTYITDPQTNNPQSPDGEDVFGSLRDYFEFQSHGILTITGDVINPDNSGIPVWLNMGSSTPYNTLGESDDLLEDAINVAITDSSWDCNYDVIGILVSQDDWTWYAAGVAWFQSRYSSNDFPQSFDYDNWFGGFVFNERNAAEYDNSDDATFSHIGIHAHELFHILGWGIPSVLEEGTLIWKHPTSVDDWSLMGPGHRTGPLRKTESPADLDPVARILMEWAEPTDVTTNLDDESMTYIEEDDDLNETFDFYRLTSSLSNEEFIVENRQYSGFNSYLPEWWEAGTKGGLLVWWHASSTSQARKIRNADDDTDVVLEGLPNVSDGDLGDPFPGATNNTEITPYTTPDTNPDISGTFTGLAVTDISSSSTTMTADLWSDFPPPAPENLEITNTGQDGQNPNLEWDPNPATGLDHYAIFKGYQSSGTGPINWNTTASATTSNTSWTDQAFTIDTAGGADVVHYRITAVDEADNESDYSNTVSTGVEEEVPSFKKAPVPTEIVLHQNYPNPFNPETRIRFELPEGVEVSLIIYNLLGERVRALVAGGTEAGFHSVRWDGKDDQGRKLASGIYVYRLQVYEPGGRNVVFVQSQKLTLLK